MTVPVHDQHQAFYLVRYNTTAYEFDFFTLGGHGDANSSAIAVASIPHGDIVVLGDRPSCSQSVDCSLTFGSNTLQYRKANMPMLFHLTWTGNNGAG